MRRTLVPVFAAILLAAAAAKARGQTPLALLSGAVAAEGFGAAVAPAGDVNGDGAPDFAVGAPMASVAGGGSGRVDLFTGTGGVPIGSVSLAAAGDAFGASLAGIGDADGDGFDDLAVGSPGNDGQGVDSGRLAVIAGGSGLVLWTLFGSGAGDRLGTALAAIGDVTGDGVFELAVGAPGSDQAASNGGRVLLLDGATGFLLHAVAGTSINGGLGGAVAGVGDVDGDLAPDYAVGSPRLPTSAPPGSVRVVSGATGAILAVAIGSLPGDLFGAAVAAAGDVDGDGVPDVLVGAPGDDGAGVDAGRVAVVSGASGGVILAVLGTGPLAGALGRAVAGAGELDGDGIPDLLVGSPMNGAGAGAASALAGFDGAVLWTMTGSLFGFGSGDFLGGAAAALGDQDGDGRPELAVGAPGIAGPGPTPAGSVRVVTCDFRLSLRQPQGPGSIAINAYCGPPGGTCFTAITANPLNAGALGTGWWMGLHIELGELLAQWTIGLPPFVSILDGSGAATFALPAGTLAPLAGLTFYAVSTAFGTPPLFPLAVAPPQAITLN